MQEDHIISMLELRRNLSDIANQVIFKGRKFVVLKNKKSGFVLSPLEESYTHRPSAEEFWDTLIDRSKLKALSLEKIRIEQKRKKKY